MKKIITLGLVSLILSLSSYASEKKDFIEKEDIVFKTINNKDIKLNLYLPNKKAEEKYKLLIWIHGGAWKRGSKDDLLKKNSLLAKSLLKEGYSIASIDYRLTNESIFPAQIRDINDAINFLYDNSKKYNLNVKKIVLMGRSAGGHLESLLTTTNTHKNIDFYLKGHAPKYKVVGSVDFFGPSNLLTLKPNNTDLNELRTPEAKLLGVTPKKKPQIAKWASPVTYVSKDTAPFILLHGDKDKNVPVAQSILLKKYLDEYGIKNELYIAKGARHGDPIFDTEKYVSKVVHFVKKCLPSK